MILFRFLRRLALFCLTLALFSVGLGLLWYRYEQNRAPLSLLDRGPVIYRALREDTREVSTQSGEARIFHEITLDGGRSGLVHFTVSLPKDVRGVRLPTLVFLGGLASGQADLDRIPKHGRNALVAYQYPLSQEPWYHGSLAGKLPELRRAALDVPSQMETLLAWAGTQPWVDRSRVSLLGFGIGAILLPSVQHLAEVHGQRLGPAVLAYGGADIPELLMANVALHPRWLRRLLVEILAVSVHPLEPALHLPQLKGDFLFINGKRDIQIPIACALKMQKLAPEPKTMIWLEAGQLDPANPVLLAEISRVGRSWMIHRKAMAE